MQVWSGDNLQRLKALLEGRNVQGVRGILGRPDRSAVSELEVCLPAQHARAEASEAVGISSVTLGC